MIVSLMLAVAQASGASVQVSGIAHRAWHECVTLKADEQSGKPEPVETIVAAVMLTCQEEEDATQSALYGTMVNAANYKKVDALMTDWRRYEEQWARKVIDAARTMPLQEVGYNE